MTQRAVLYARINDYDESKLAEQLQMYRERASHHGQQILAETARGVTVYARLSGYHNLDPDQIRQHQALWEHAMGCDQPVSHSLSSRAVPNSDDSRQ